VRRAFCGVIVIATVTASTARAQTTADGVAAFLQGDYQRAAEILQPIAERFPLLDDGTAQFFMARMYETGRGVQVDRLRACVLYMRASLDSSTPTVGVRIDTAQRFRASLSREQSDECTFLASVGFHHGLERRTFDLEPGFWVTLDPHEAIVTSDGREKRVQLSTPLAGIRFLPAEHTELSVGGSRPERRHFIELAAWRPEDHGAKWILWWQLFEVIRTDWISLAVVDELATISAPEPPSDVDVHGSVRVRVGDAGGAELLVLKGPNARAEHIESESERRARTDSARARDDALRRIDWTAVRDTRRTPTLTYADSDGCAYILLYGWSPDRLEALSVRADQALLQLSDVPQTFDLAVPRIGLDVTVHVFQRPLHSWPFCTDVGESNPVPRESWRPSAGRVTIDVSTESRGNERIMRATVRIIDAEFMRDDGVRVKQTAPIVLTGTVGWTSG
jgi:hypothetical protein